MSHQNSKGRIANVHPYGPTATETIDIREPVDTMPSDLQPPGVDEEKEPQSLEEALTG